MVREQCPEVGGRCVGHCLEADSPRRNQDSQRTEVLACPVEGRRCHPVVHLETAVQGGGLVHQVSSGRATTCLLAFTLTMPTASRAGKGVCRWGTAGPPRSRRRAGSGRG